MRNDIEKLTQKINALIAVLEKTSNPSIKFFKGVIDILQNCKTGAELKRALDDHLIHAGRVKDYGGYNREQCNSFNEMWEVANSIYEAK